MNKRLWMAALLAFSGSLAAQAEDELGYNYVSLGYTDLSGDFVFDAGGLNLDLSIEGDGLNVGLSVGVRDHIHVFGNYLDLELDPIFGIDVDVTLWEVGAGWHGLLGNRADLLIDASYVSGEIEAKAFGVSVSDEGVGLIGGIRVMPVPKLELVGFVGWIGGIDATDATVGAGGGKIFYNITKFVTIGAVYTTNSAGDSLNLGLRIYWGKDA